MQAKHWCIHISRFYNRFLRFLAGHTEGDSRISDILYLKIVPLFIFKPSVNIHTRVAHSNIISRLSLYFHLYHLSTINGGKRIKVTQQKSQVRSPNGIATSTSSIATKIPAFVSDRYRIMWTIFDQIQDVVLFLHMSFLSFHPLKSFCSFYSPVSISTITVFIYILISSSVIYCLYS